MVVRSKKPAVTANRSTTRTAAPVKKRTAPAPAPVKKRVAAKPAPVQKKPTPAPVKKVAPAKRPVVTKASSTPAPAAPKALPVTAYDVLSAHRAVEIAQARHEELKSAFWASQDATVSGAVEHAAKSAVEKDTPPRSVGRAPKEGVRKALAPEPKAIDEYFDIDTVKGMTIVELRELAGRLADEGVITERKIKTDIYAQMEAAGLFREDGTSSDDEGAEDVDEDGEEGEEDFDEYEDDETEASDAAEGDDESDDEADDDGDDDDSFTVEDLKKMSLKNLQDLSEKWGIPWKGLTQKELLAAIVEAAGSEEDADEEDADEEETEEFEDEADDSEEEDEEQEEDDEEDEGEEITLEEIEAMNAEEITKLLVKLEIRIPAKIKNNADKLREMLLSALDEQDDEDDDE